MTLKKNAIAFIIIGILGTLGHFFYEWSNKNALIGMFFPVNESVWEHLKLIFFPTVIYSIFEYITMKKKPQNYIPTTAIGLYCGIFTIIAIYYISNGILGVNVDFINIISYYIALIVLLCKKNQLLNRGQFYSKNPNTIFLLILIINGFLFMVWSFNPPTLGIFEIP